MDMDLWWCPVCERAITEKNNEPPPDLIKRPTSSSRHTSRGGVCGSQESLYCSEACRQVEESNGRFAFEQLAACLPVYVDRSCSEEPESESTLSGTDEPNTDRSRSLSLGRRSESLAASKATSVSSSLDISLSNPDHKLKPSNPLVELNVSQHQSQERPPNARRVPILLSPNGTPLVQPIFPHRPALAPHQRRHHSQFSPIKRSPLHIATAARIVNISKPSAVNPSNSVPTYPSTAPTGHRTTANRPKSILNNQSATTDDMEFGADARLEKPTYLWAHYDLFYRPRRGSRRGRGSSPTEPEHDSIQVLDRNLVASTRQLNQPDPHKRYSLGKQFESTKSTLDSKPETRRASEADDQNNPGPARVSTPDRLVTKAVEIPKPHFRARKAGLLGENKYSRSWSWDHLPADVPQYPAMDLEQIRVSKLLREQKLRGHQYSCDQIPSQFKTHPVSQLTAENSSVNTIIPSSKYPVQTKKKLFVFQ